jgi:hypothetical protein
MSLRKGGHVARAYPKDLAALAAARWAEVAPAPVGEPGSCTARRLGAAPDLGALEELLDACYQASLMREEERPVAFRLVLAGPEAFPQDGGPPSGFHRLAFPRAVPLNEDVLRRLSPAADYHRSLIGAKETEGGGLEVWGLVHSGPGWVRATQGGRGQSAPLPPAPLVHVTGPGRVAVHRGDAEVAELRGGALSSGPGADVFASRWLPESFAPVRTELVEVHEEARRGAAAAGEPWAPLDPDLIRLVGQHTVRRVIAVMRAARHGGTLAFAPPELADKLSSENPYVSFRHPFAEGEPRRRFRTLIVGVTNRLAQAHGKGTEGSYPRAVGWEEYEGSRDEGIAALDEAVFEVAHLVAGLSAVDGAVVMTKRFEILGFGAEISGALPPRGRSPARWTRRGKGSNGSRPTASAPATVRPTACAGRCRGRLRSWSARTAASGS